MMLMHLNKDNNINRFKYIDVYNFNASYETICLKAFIRRNEVIAGLVY